jgi:hypothetical protein
MSGAANSYEEAEEFNRNAQQIDARRRRNRESARRRRQQRGNH